MRWVLAPLDDWSRGGLKCDIALRRPQIGGHHSWSELE